MSERLTYRLLCEDDLPGLLRLWEGAGWGVLTPEQWRAWFVEGPQGPSLVTVGVDERGEVAAQEMFAPARAVVGGREVRALRLSAPILREELRGRSLKNAEHPIIGLLKVSMSAAAEQGFAVVYSLPEYAWLPVFRRLPSYGIKPFAEAVYACASLPFEAARSTPVRSAAAGLEARAVEEFGEEFEELWREAKSSFPIDCGVVRDKSWLAFRNSGRIAVEVRAASDGRLVGYSATKRATGLLADLLAREPAELKLVVAATLCWLEAERVRSVPEGLTHLKVMRTPALAPALDALGFEPSDYRFAFTCNSFDPSLTLEEIAPERWYVLPGD
ncbi:MAG TPA: hypothetical protein VF240_20720 [Pyrinomonadaceae bacterium]